MVKKAQLKKEDSRRAHAQLRLFFDHNGKVHIQYNGTSKKANYPEYSMPPTQIIKDEANLIDQTIWIYGNDSSEGEGASKYGIHNRNMVSVELAIPFIIELLKNGEIDVSSDYWEDFVWVGDK